MSIVTGFASGGPEIGPIDSQALVALVEEDEQRRDASTPLDAGSNVTQIPIPTQEQVASQPPMRAAMALADVSGQAAGQFEGLVGSNAAQGGDPTATSDLLAQIARCLPTDLRPRLAFSQLAVSIGADGRLSAAPQVTSALPQLSTADRAIADRIVQAVLQCGPYEHPDAVGRIISLPVDFTMVKASPAVGRIARIG